MADARFRPYEMLRVAALEATGLVATGHEERFDRIARITGALLDAPIAMVNLVGEDRQWGKACIGLPTSDMPRGQSFCQHAILRDEPLIVSDTRTDPRFAGLPLVTGEHAVRSYLGHPVHDLGGYRVGTLCVIDRRPREWTVRELEVLADLANWVDVEIAWAHLREAADRERATESRLQAVIDSAAEGIITLDDEGRVVVINPAAREMLGYTSEELVGRVLHDVAHAVHTDGTPYPIDECPSHRTLSAGVSHRLLEEVYWRRDGSAAPVDLSSTPIVEDGSITGAVVVFRDATERRELERMKNDFVSSVSHELRTPLTSIRGYLEGVIAEESGPLTADQREDLEIVDRNAARLHTLIDDLLFLSRMQAGRLQLDCRPISLDGVLAPLVEDLTPVARARDLQLEASLAAVVAEGDGPRLEQCFANLLSNAVKFGRPGTTVHVTARQRDGDAVVEVRDRGPGIPADELERLGQRFFRASTAGAVEGTGLGLAITREIVDRHGGRLDVESELGEGSTFRIVLPSSGGRPR